MNQQLKEWTKTTKSFKRSNPQVRCSKNKIVFKVLIYCLHHSCLKILKEEVGINVTSNIAVHIKWRHKPLLCSFLGCLGFLRKRMWLLLFETSSNPRSPSPSMFSSLGLLGGFNVSFWPNRVSCPSAGSAAAGPGVDSTYSTLSYIDDKWVNK